MKTNQTQATVTPWKIKTKPFVGSVLSAKIKSETIQIQNAEDWPLAQMLGHDDKDKANAALIVQAVNEYAALKAVADAAKKLMLRWALIPRTGSPCEDFDGESNLKAGKRLIRSLDNLAIVESSENFERSVTQ